MFRFAAPEYLYLIAIIPIMIAIYIFAIRARKRSMARFANAETLSQLTPEASPRRKRNKFIIFILALLLIITSLSRPQFGSKLKEVTRTGIEIMLAVDVSNSMLAEDFEPNRLERTKFAIDRLTEQLTDDRIGLIIFAGDAYVQLPITSDYKTARNFAQSISPNMISKQGTSMGAAISLASQSFSGGSEGSRVVILISDGENHEDDTIAAAQEAVNKGIKIYTIGIGTPKGAPININGEMLKDEEGKIVVSKLNEQGLQDIALTTGGSYIRATNRSMGLTEIIQKINEVEKKNLSSMIFEDYTEQYQYLLGIGLFLLLADLIMIDRKNRIFRKFNIFK